MMSLLTQDLEFASAKFRDRKFEVGKLITKRHVPCGPPNKFALDSGVIKTKKVSFSKKLVPLSFLVSIAWPGLFRTLNDLLRPQADIAKRFRLFFFSAEKTL